MFNKIIPIMAISLLVLIISISIIFYYVPEEKRVTHIIISSYEGMIVEKFFRKTPQIRVITSEGRDLTIAFISQELNFYAQVGDSIVKLPNQNKCEIIKKDTTIKDISYIGYHKSVESSKYWIGKKMNKPLQIVTVYSFLQ